MAEAASTVPEGGDAITLENYRLFPEGRKFDSCIQCGTCSAACPYGNEMRYTPRKLINMLRAGLAEKAYTSEALLHCVSCWSCAAKCPRGLELTDVLLPLFKEQTLANLEEMPSELQKALQNDLRYGNPMGESPRKRAAWVKTAGVPVPILSEIKRPVDVLWIVECYTSYYPRGHANARATARILNRLGVDFAILGNEEKCTGECGKLSWEPGLFDTLMEQNLAVYRKYQFQRVMTSCPHSYLSLAQRYRPAGLDRPVEQSSPFLARHLDRLKPFLTKRLDRSVTYHDSCCLGRRGGFFDEPRAVLRAIPGVRIVEMAHSGLNSICCGGGGGGMWLDTYYKEKGSERLSERRVKEAVDTGADVLAVSCTYEVSRFEDALKVLGADKKMVVRDVTELVAEAMEA